MPTLGIAQITGRAAIETGVLLPAVLPLSRKKDGPEAKLGMLRNSRAHSMLGSELLLVAHASGVMECAAVRCCASALLSNGVALQVPPFVAPR